MPVTYKCPSCGAAMAFDSEKGTLSCEYCGTDLPIEEVEQTLAQEEYEPLGDQEQKGTEDFKVYRCLSCGAEMLTDEDTTAAVCSFCGAPGLMESRPYSSVTTAAAWTTSSGPRGSSRAGSR